MGQGQRELDPGPEPKQVARLLRRLGQPALELLLFWKVSLLNWANKKS